MRRTSLGALMAFAAATAAPAQVLVTPPKISQAEGLQLFEAGGFKVEQGNAINVCGSVSEPRFVFMDLNDDGALEAVALDKNPACYGGDGLWRAIMRDSGKLGFETSRSGGWPDARVTNDCVRIWKYAGDGYQRPASCAEQSFAKASDAGVTAADRTAAMRAAGFVAQGDRWMGGDGNCEAAVEPSDIKDLNGDGRLELVITETGTFCYGNTGQGFYIMQKSKAGAWKTLYQSPGIPEFLTTKGEGGWPDIEVGGPGFCFPVIRFDGSTYVNDRQVEHQPGACAR